MSMDIPTALSIPTATSIYTAMSIPTATQSRTPMKPARTRIRMFTLVIRIYARLLWGLRCRSVSAKTPAPSTD